MNGVRKAAIGHPMDILLLAKDSSRLRVSKAIKKPSGLSSEESMDTEGLGVFRVVFVGLV